VEIHDIRCGNSGLDDRQCRGFFSEGAHQVGSFAIRATRSINWHGVLFVPYVNLRYAYLRNILGARVARSYGRGGSQVGSRVFFVA
jgi:hypothetical protein